MDKRWIFILIIIIIAAICGYFIAESSPNVGNAIASVNKSTVTLPHGFSVGSSEGAHLELINKRTNEKIYIEDLGKGDSSQVHFEDHLKKITKSRDVEIIENLTNTTSNGIKLYIIHYINLNDENPKNESIAYYYTYNHTYYAKLTGFDNINQQNDKITFIADTTETDYKKAQDPKSEKSSSTVNFKRTIKGEA